jgi:uncharacterized protein YfaS (alpha-2-macroglobulin family)
LPAPDAAGSPLKATVITRLTDGSGRTTERRLTAPVRPSGPVIGIRSLFDESVAEGAEARFEAITLAPDLTATPMQARWTLNRIETRYQWHRMGGDWNWEPTTRRTRIATALVDLGAEPLAIAHPVDWGRYELVIEGADAAASVAFHAGWEVSGDGGASPDRLELSLDKPRYRAGDVARLRIVPRAGGKALIAVMSDRLIARQEVTVPAGESVIDVPVTADRGVGAYAVATVIRPMDVAAGRNPVRALGVAHAAVDPAGKALSVAIDAPEVAEPRGVQPVRLTVTGFQAPDPMGHYFGQRRLGVALRDVYGRLIDGMNGALGLVRSGGDGDAGMRSQSPPDAGTDGPVQRGGGGRRERRSHRAGGSFGLQRIRAADGGGVVGVGCRASGRGRATWWCAIRWW